MAQPIYNPTGVRAFGLKAEAAFGADNEATDTHIAFNYEGGPIERKNWNYYKNDDEVNGAFLPDQAQIINKHIEDSWKNKLTPNMIGLVCGCIADEYSVALAPGETTIYKHVFKFLSSGLLASSGLKPFVSRNMIEASGNLITLYKGIILNGFEISGDRAGFINGMADIIGYNGHASSSKTKAYLFGSSVKCSQPYMKYGDFKFKKGTYNYGTEAFTLVTDQHSQLMTASVKHKKTAEKQAQFGDQNGTVTQIVPVGYETSINCKFELTAMADFLTDWEAQNQFAIQIPIAGPVIAGAAAGTRFQVNTVFPKVQIESAEISPEGSKLVRDAVFSILSNPKGQDDQSEFLVVEVVDKVPNYVI